MPMTMMVGAVTNSVLSMNPFWKACGVYVASDILGFIISLTTGSHVHLDLIGTGAFALAAIPTLLTDSASATQYWSSIAVTLWATRLAGFLFFRATQVGNDMRLYDMLSSVNGMIQFWGVRSFGISFVQCHIIWAYYHQTPLATQVTQSF